ncbi:hypothetical protein CONCODRAFT_14106 [Conidiobolus coronatus NRRL 28638]|uniref:Uncharacterized protein n=1 Tax=Conidiobolus coronatus (strain ATCC 28846 / CBS 209.66 / NRRL 28638) TaxID=796925 RepID=A0A137NPM8_CONC2|nr:hypothetical protein CONCODRAFT_14106 [Conidiobolus coronatus NRRL 28638]|eukprot:KXN64695.1 hypothetical protein CONCODRAFT_14106 [Conidiobolus coronatus NRRL 28638]
MMKIYYFLGVFTGTENKVSCNPGANNPTITKAVFGLIAVFNLAAIISGIYVTIASHNRLGIWIESFSNKEFLDPKIKKNSSDSVFLDGFKGIYTLFAFMIDPAIQNALKYTFDKLRKMNLDKYEMNDVE